ncbi:MAG: glycosyltransferase family 4 protein [Planctomycetota bacterium]
MRILMLSPEDVGSAHGGAVHTLSMAEAFGRLNHEVMLVAPGEHGFDVGAQHAAPLHKNAGMMKAQCAMRILGIASTWRAWTLAETCRKFSPDVIYERQLVTGGLGAHWGRKWGAKVVYEVNSPHRLEYLHRFPWLSPLAGVLAAWERRQFKGVDVMVTTHELMVPEGFKGRAMVGPWAVTHPAKGESALDVPELRGRKAILVTGSFRSWHGLGTVLAVVKALGDGPWGILLAGADTEGTWKRRIEGVTALPVVALGRVDPLAMGAVYLRADVLLAPFDPPIPGKPFYYSPFKVLEALSRSCPVVTDNHDTLRQLVSEPWCGRLMESRDPRTWATALRELLELPRPDTSLGLSWARDHAWVDHAKVILEALS